MYNFSGSKFTEINKKEGPKIKSSKPLKTSEQVPEYLTIFAVLIL
jgi:hypothetical protein